MQQVVVTVNPQPTLTINNPNVVVNTGSSVTLDATSNASIIWYNAAGTALPGDTAGPFPTPGFYTFTAVATLGSCSVSRNVFVSVIDADECPPLTERKYADTQSWSSIITGGVADAPAAVDGNPRTFSTIVTGLGLLGIGTTWQTLQWNQTIAAGTPVTVKLGSEYSGLIVAGAYSIVGTKRNASNIPVDIGNIQPVSGSLVDLLTGQNTFEFTFVPANGAGPQAYDGVRIIVGSLVSVAQNVKVYEAYYDRNVTQIACNSDDAEDVFYGAVDLGVGVASATVGVADPYDAVDTDVNTYATMFSGAGILATAELTVDFHTPTFSGDTTQIIVSRPATILDLNLLAGISIQLFLGNSPVGAPIVNNSSLLSLTLLGGGAQARLTIAPQSQPYDRIRIRFGGVASVLDLLRVNDIRRSADTSVVGADNTNTVQACQGTSIQLTTTQQDCSSYIWYDAATGGNVVSTGNSFTIPATLAAGTYTYYIQAIRYGCPTFDRRIVTVVVGATAPSTAIASVSINGGADDTICTPTGTVTLAATLAAAPPITNPIFYWYNGNTLVTGQTTSSLVLNGLAPGTYTYSVGISSDEYCQTAVADRTQVTFTILPFSTVANITASNALICTGTNAVITPSSALANPQFYYYFSNNNTQPITNGTVGGVTYTIAPNGTLTVSGLTALGSPYTYYIGLVSDASCLNQSGNFKPVTITVIDSGIPTTTDTTQDFCVSENPTVADLQVNEPNAVFYDAASGGNLIPANTALVNGTTYYAAYDASVGCASTARLAITATISNTATPTTIDTTQNFCISANPTIADIQVNETGAIFYSAATGGTALNPTAALVNGATYYAALVNGTTNCESSVRLAITVTLDDVPTPSTNDTTQQFCFSENATVADIQVNESNVIWYNLASGGSLLPATTALTTGNYYAAIAQSGCESSVRLLVAVTIINPAAPTTTDTTQDFCLSENPTIADIQVNETGVVFYNLPTGGTALTATTPLTNGIYYASITEEGCESSVRLGNHNFNIRPGCANYK
ncbi:immunoglobulin domain-containing protein [Flavobacterium sp. 3HN19-14]|uniref:immunoglobulin domain-containing protein n=1 Tax=Flavobacterium sp. 3HN19-14 TaxID=3448133 RepID=UPI003EE40D5C